jgi:hypothetical protein
MDENQPQNQNRRSQKPESDQKKQMMKQQKQSKKRRLSARSLLLACIKLVDDYNCEALPDIAAEDHAAALMPLLNASHPHDQSFLTQVSKEIQAKKCFFLLSYLFR